MRKKTIHAWKGSFLICQTSSLLATLVLILQYIIKNLHWRFFQPLAWFIHTQTRESSTRTDISEFIFLIIFFFLTVCPIVFTTPLECSQKSSFNNCSRHIITYIPLVFPFVCRSKRLNTMPHKNTFNDSSSLLQTISTCRIIESFIFWVRDANQPVTNQDETTSYDTC